MVRTLALVRVRHWRCLRNRLQHGNRVDYSLGPVGFGAQTVGQARGTAVQAEDTQKADDAPEEVGDHAVRQRLADESAPDRGRLGDPRLARRPRRQRRGDVSDLGTQWTGFVAGHPSQCLDCRVSLQEGAAEADERVEDAARDAWQLAGVFVKVRYVDQGDTKRLGEAAVPDRCPASPHRLQRRVDWEPCPGCHHFRPQVVGTACRRHATSLFL
ncbi:hypothetical protein Psuf_039300 [Phytohabitans suffuscus]|uniref:Uncharacterized protein n=1 Tax=Phytohabitans suffuscus TaxID=624315 RepID=A0A6F8YKL5_9ACTN|nr:hypothetical protein [Phytohabitans suffuscus]BCB86617.1 hypothetical protein Psuf_039300 [Phytohabitans suffuscus]